MTKSRTDKISNIEDIYTLSSLQEGMLFHTLYSPDERPYLDHIVCELRAEPQLNVTAFKRAIQQIVDRHQALRTAFIWNLDRRPQQVVLRRLDVTLREEDWRELTADEHSRRLDSLLKEDRAGGYDLSRPPLMRLILIRLQSNLYHLVFSYHHIIMDAWSAPVVFKELTAFYESFSRAEDLKLERPRPFRVYIEWLRQRRMQDAEAFWRPELEGFSAPTSLFYDRKEDGLAEEGRDYNDFHCELEKSTTASLQSLARRQGLTVNTLIQGAWALLLTRYANTTDVLFGTVVSGRPYELSGIESMVGLFTNTLPVRVQVEPGQLLLPWLTRLQEKQFQLRRYEWTPLQKIQEWSPLAAGNSLFDSIVNFQNVPFNSVSEQRQEYGLQLRVVRHDPKNNFALTLMVFPGQSLSIRLLYDCRRFSDDAILRALGHLRVMLEGMLAHPDHPLSEIPYLTEAEKQQILVEWNDSESPWPKDSCVHKRFESQALLAPDAIAAAYGDEWLTYDKLNRRANQLAWALLEHSPTPEAVVALCSDRNLEFLTAMLAIFKAGLAYLPLDPWYPEQRLLQILELSEAAQIVTTARFLPVVQKIIDRPLPARRPSVLALDDLLRQEWPQENLPERCGPGNLAYVIYTSGSTGSPKGAMVEHGGLLNHLYANIADLNITGQDIVGQTASQSFDISVWQFMAALLVGGRVQIFGDDITHDPAQLLGEIERNHLSLIQVVPSFMHALLDEIASRGQSRPALANLACLVTIGEALPPDLCREWLSYYPGVPVLNAYGPTECSDNISHHFVTEPPPEGAIRVPIGRPIANIQLYILDRWLQPAPLQMPGDLLAGGAGVGRGYLKNPQRTAEAFIPNPFARAPGERLYKTGDLACHLPNGAIDFLGRNDYQIKIRGFRVELGEIEALLRRHDEVREAIVVAHPGSMAGDKRLVAYVVPELRPAAEDTLEGEVSDVGTNRVAEWRIIFDEVYRQKNVSQADQSLHLHVWVDSYTGEPFAEDEMLECVEASAQRILRLKPSRVLDIGCGSGLLLFRVAPNCELYCGTDISKEALAALQQRLNGNAQLSGARLLCQSADDFSELTPGQFDVVILNEVAQYFPDAHYLLKVLEGAIRMVRASGFVFVGGVRNLLLLNAFHTSVQLFRAAPSLACDQLLQRVQTQVAKEGELAIAPEFFLALRHRFPEVTRVWLVPKGGRPVNELTKFRYDAILEIRGESAGGAGCAWIAWQDKQWTLPELRERLASNAPDSLGISGVPNSRLLRDAKAFELLSNGDRPKTVNDLRESLARYQTGLTGLDPEELREMASELGYQVDVSWANTDMTGSYDLLLTKRGSVSSIDLPALEPGRTVSLKAWQSYTNHSQRRPSAEDLTSVLRSYLKNNLPDHMVPSDFMTPPSFPLTPNGKVDRSALPAVSQRAAHLYKPVEATRRPTEELVMNIWSEILGAQVGPESDFFESGGHSLLGTQVISRVRKIFNVELPLSTLFDAATVALFSKRIDAAVKESRGLSLTPITRAPEASVKRLSFAQQRLWIVNQMDPGDWAYNLTTAARIDGSFQVETFRGAMNEIIRRHEVLRTRFDVVGGEPAQVICAARPIAFPMVDLSGLTTAELEAETRRLVSEESRRTFDLLNGPLLRVYQLKWREQTDVILFSMHHIVSDGWSMGVLISEMTALYNAYRRGEPSPLPELSIQYADFAYWQREWLQSGVAEKQLSYWKGRLAGAPSTLNLPLDRPRPQAPSSRGHSYPFRIADDSFKAIEYLCRREGATTFMALFAAFNVFLYRITGQTDIVIGADVANRDRQEVEDLIGFFVNLLPLRIKLTGHSTFREALGQVRGVALEAYERQDLPFDLLTKELRLERGLSQAPIFDVLFVFQNFRMENLEMADTRLSLIPIDHGTARFDLALMIEKSQQGLTGRWTYRTDLFDPGTIVRWSARFEKLLASILERPDAYLEDLDLLDPMEKMELDSLQKRSFEKFKSLQPKSVIAPE